MSVLTTQHKFQEGSQETTQPSVIILWDHKKSGRERGAETDTTLENTKENSLFLFSISLRSALAKRRNLTVTPAALRALSPTSRARGLRRTPSEDTVSRGSMTKTGMPPVTLLLGVVIILGNERDGIGGPSEARPHSSHDGKSAGFNRPLLDRPSMSPVCPEESTPFILRSD